MATDVTTLEQNKALARRAIGYNHGVADDPTTIFAPDFVAYLAGQPSMDRETFEHALAGFNTGFPGYTYEIEDQIAQDNLVFNRLTWRGTHGGEFAGVSATGRPIELTGINLFKIKDGRVVEQRAELDFFGLLQQVGAIPNA